MINRTAEFLKTRFSPHGRMKKQLSEALKIYKKYPDSDYSKSFLISILKKYFYGSNSVKYESLVHEAWTKIGINTEDLEVIVDDLKFKNDTAFKSEFSDIFLASDLEIHNFKTDNQNIAREILKTLSVEGSYEYNKVKVMTGDIVIDAGANMGLFSIFAAINNAAKVYAFEPQRDALRILEENISKNKFEDKIKIEPFGLSNVNDVLSLNYSGNGHSSGSIVMHDNQLGSEQIECVTIDTWVERNNLKKIDFIKADIEGAERFMLMGAEKTLKKFGPRLAICIYHLPDDPQVIASIIKKANSKYRIKKTSHKIFAYIP
jgi:FkbM family methyltransferase